MAQHGTWFAKVEVPGGPAEIIVFMHCGQVDEEAAMVTSMQNKNGLWQVAFNSGGRFLKL